MTSDKADGETGVLQLNIGSSPSDLQLLCRSEGCSAICCLCMSGRLLEQATCLILHEKNFCCSVRLTRKIKLTTQASLAKDQGKDN